MVLDDLHEVPVLMDMGTLPVHNILVWNNHRLLQMLSPVSYTHLDVYKRQVKGFQLGNDFFLMFDLPLLIVIGF